MTNLISSQYSRLFKSKLFYLSLIFFIGMAIYVVYPEIEGYDWTLKFYSGGEMSFFHNFERTYPLRDFVPTPDDLTEFYDYDFIESWHLLRLYADDMLKLSFPPFIVTMAVVVSLLIGSEFGYKTIRNKLIAGYSRTAVYISNLIVCLTAGVIMQLVYMISVMIPMCILYIKYKSADCEVIFFQYSLKENLLFHLMGFLIITVYTSLYLLFAMLLSSRTRSASASLLTVITLIILGGSINISLYPSLDNDFFDFAYYGGSGFTETAEQTRETSLSGVQRDVYKFLDDFLPVRQAYILAKSDEFPPRMTRYLIYDFGLIAALTAVGIAGFNRKELN